jgi:hypothetical protein
MLVDLATFITHIKMRLHKLTQTHVCGHAGKHALWHMDALTVHTHWLLGALAAGKGTRHLARLPVPYARKPMPSAQRAPSPHLPC